MEFLGLELGRLNLPVDALHCVLRRHVKTPHYTSNCQSVIGSHFDRTSKMTQDREGFIESLRFLPAALGCQHLMITREMCITQQGPFLTSEPRAVELSKVGMPAVR